PADSTSLDASSFVIEKKNVLDIILFCGSPGSGKSTFYRKHLQPLGYQRVNQDLLKTRDKCLTAATNFLAERTSVAVGELADNTNADQDVRAVWVQLAQRFKVPIRCVHFTASTKLCEHNDTVRAIAGGQFNPEKRTILPHSAFSSFASRYKRPKMEEGFQDIVPVDFQVEQARICSGCKLMNAGSLKVTTTSARYGPNTGSRTANMSPAASCTLAYDVHLCTQIGICFPTVPAAAEDVASNPFWTSRMAAGKIPDVKAASGCAGLGVAGSPDEPAMADA
ncbi:MAG: hypothetical protein Q9177_005038, partial [Variospora cf. flavescens]